MELISNNPYRVAGILSSNSQKELLRQKSKITAYLKVSKMVHSDYDFDFLQKMIRTEHSTKTAFSKIEQNKDRLFHSLFWFLEANSFDTIALEHLKKGDVLKAGAIWEKVTLGKEMSDLNFSCISNLGTLKLLGNTESEIQEGIETKIKLIESPSYKDYVHTVADETFTIDHQSQIEHFVDAILNEFKDHYQAKNIINLFENCNGMAREYVTKRSTQEPISYLETKIESTKSKRSSNRIKAYEYGLRLHADCQQELSSLRSILGEQDLKYKMIADKLAQEIMQCGIDYFNAWDADKDVSDESLELLNHARSIAIGSQIKERITSNLKGINEYKNRESIQIINVLEQISKTYRKSGYNPVSGQTVKVNEIKVIHLLKKEITIDAVERIAKLNDYAIISDFYNQINFLFNKIGRTKFTYSIALCFFNSLPNNNNLKKDANELALGLKPSGTSKIIKLNQYSNDILLKIGIMILFAIVIVIIGFVFLGIILLIEHLS